MRRTFVPSRRTRSTLTLCRPRAAAGLQPQDTLSRDSVQEHDARELLDIHALVDAVLVACGAGPVVERTIHKASSARQNRRSLVRLDDNDCANHRQDDDETER
jgi:hypothetical protein